jgi:quinol monooxygenase YgiN
MSDPELILVANVHGLAGPTAELSSLLSELADGARGEPGCISFRVLSDDDPGEFVLLSSWTSEGALRTHYTTAHYRATASASGRCWRGRATLSSIKSPRRCARSIPTRRTQGCWDAGMKPLSQPRRRRRFAA